MYIYNNTCGVNNKCDTGYSLYFPCVNSITRGEKTCSEFYIIDNANKKEVDLREVDDITLNMYGRYNCSFGSFSYPENIKSLQMENFTDVIFDVDFSDVINLVKLNIDIVDENNILIESYNFDENLILDVSIDGKIGYFLKNSDKDGVLYLNAFDTNTYMFLGWNIDESDEFCDVENIYDFLIKSKSLKYNVNDDCTIRAVYRNRREYIIRVADDNYNSSFVVEYMGKKTTLREGDFITALEGHDIKVSCIPNDTRPYKFDKWDDGYENPYRVFNVGGDNLIISLKAICSLNVDDYIEYIDNIDANLLNKFNNIYPTFKDKIFVDSYYINNIYLYNCEIDILNGNPYINIINGGYIQIIDINEIGNFKLSLNNVGDDCKFYIDNREVFSSAINKNDFIFEFDGGIMKLTGDGSYLFGLSLKKENINNKGKCLFCLNSDETLKLYPGDLILDGGIIVNGNPYGLSSVNFAKVTDITPIIIKNFNT